MIRVLLLRALLFAVPFAIYGAYLLLSRARSIVLLIGVSSLYLPGACRDARSLSRRRAAAGAGQGPGAGGGPGGGGAGPLVGAPL